MNNCEHDWKLGPFYILVAVTYEEPDYYPPQGNLNIEHCTKCGLLRLAEQSRWKIGKNLSE